ncbi:MAG: hypothetical protein Q7R39_02585 [Dehalococcoidia bacterium]|nr:hypothetical protein [Dehalococcoidia bacterium]
MTLPTDHYPALQKRSMPHTTRDVELPFTGIFQHGLELLAWLQDYAEGCALAVEEMPTYGST